MRRQFRVSTKVALFNSDKSKVFVIHMDKDNKWGLPGGHVEENESPDNAIARELLEECGVRANNLSHADFFLHSEGKLILTYVGTVLSEELDSQQNELEGKPKWLTRDEFDVIKIEPGYRQLVLSHWQ